MKFTAETRMSDLGFMLEQLVGKYVDRNKHTTLLFPMEVRGVEELAIADFNPHGFCTNAASYREHEKAWRQFIETVQADLDGEPQSPYNEDDDIVDIPVVSEAEQDLLRALEEI